VIRQRLSPHDGLFLTKSASRGVGRSRKRREREAVKGERRDAKVARAISDAEAACPATAVLDMRLETLRVERLSQRPEEVDVGVEVEGAREVLRKGRDSVCAPFS
jgi:hypothetical protein